MQTQVNVHRNGIAVLPARRCNRGIDHGDDRQADFVANAQEQPEIVAVHVRRHCNDDPIALAIDSLPDLFELTADEIGGAEMLETLIRQRLGQQIGPVVIVNPSWLDARIGIRIATCRQSVVLEQCEPRLAIQRCLVTENCDAGVVDVCGKQSHDSGGLVCLHVSDELVIHIGLAVEDEPLLQKL